MKRRRFTLTSLAFLTALSTNCQARGSDGPPVEVGKVSWLRNYKEGLQTAKTTGKPIFLFFQEVPG